MKCKGHGNAQPFASDLVPPVAALDALSFLDLSSAPSSALLSRNPAHNSASVSFPVPAEDGSVMNSVLSDAVLGVRLNGESGSLRELEAVPGRARPACSRCSSLQFR